jgi:hypothetical protein
MKNRIFALQRKYDLIDRHFCSFKFFVLKIFFAEKNVQKFKTFEVQQRKKPALIFKIIFGGTKWPVVLRRRRQSHEITTNSSRQRKIKQSRRI